MRLLSLITVLLLVSCTGTPATRQLPLIAPLVPAADQLALLGSDDPKLARNKQHVWDFWRIVYEGGHMEHVEDYMTPAYIQHNPNVSSGRDEFVRTIGVARPPRPVKETSDFPIIDIIAEGDMVVVMWARKVRDREYPDEIYDMTWFDVFRLDPESGLIDEHWDSSERWDASGRPPGAEFFP